MFLPITVYDIEPLSIVDPHPISQFSSIITTPICGYLKLLSLFGKNPKPCFPTTQLSRTFTLLLISEFLIIVFEPIEQLSPIETFFSINFNNLTNLIPDLVDQYYDNPLSVLGFVRCNNWSKMNTFLIGDACHATVPFYGQGMNSGFEDCTVLNDLMIKHKENWEAVFKEYNEKRKPDGDALQDLSLDNYCEMRDYVADEGFLLRKKIEAKYTELYPKKWLPLYSQVTFSTIPYHVAYNQGKIQDSIMDEVMNMPNIDEVWDSEEVMNKISEKSEHFNFEV